MSDLISRSALIEYLEKVTVTEGITFETGFKQILTDIKNQPTVEAKPVVHGEQGECEAMTIDEAIIDIKENIKPVVGGKSLDMAVKSLEMQKEYTWIACDEELPKGRKVLLQTDENQMTVAFLDKKMNWYSDSGDGWCVDIDVKPVAWMPLPQTYREKGQ